MVKKTILSFLLLLSVSGVVAQDVPKIDIQLSRDTIMIGDQIDLMLIVDKGVEQQVMIPVITTESTEGKIEVIGEPIVDTLELDGSMVKFKVTHKITSFESGIYNIEPFPMLYVNDNSTDTILSNPISLLVDTYLIDTATYVMHDITPILKEPFTLNELKYIVKDALKSPFTYIGLLLAIIILLIWYLYRRHKNKNVYVKPQEPPHITAIKELEIIANEKLWENSQYKTYFTKITDVIRIYIDARYGVNAMELTSKEIFDAFNSIDVPSKEMERLKELLLLSDFVKFAKAKPTEDECRNSFDNAYYFVEETKIMPLTVENIDEITNS